MKYFKSLLKDSDRTCTGVLCSHPLSRDIRVCIWVYLWIDDYSVVEFIGKIFIAVVSIIAALGFLLYGGRLFFMLRRFPIESKGRRKKLHEIANEIGVPILVDAPKNRFAGGPFLRIQVDIDVTKPLMRGKMIHIEGAEKGWVFFKYEKLPTCCYRKVWYTWPSRSGVSKGT